MEKYRCRKDLDFYWFKDRYYTPSYYSHYYHHKVPIFVNSDKSVKTTEFQGYRYFEKVTFEMKTVHKIALLKELQKLYKKDIIVTITKLPININDIKIDEKFSRIICTIDDVEIILNEEGKLTKNGAPLLENVQKRLGEVVKSLYVEDIQPLDILFASNGNLSIVVEEETYDNPFFHLLKEPDEIEKLNCIDLSLHPNFITASTKYSLHELRLQYIFSKLDPDFQDTLRDIIFWNE